MSDGTMFPSPTSGLPLHGPKQETGADQVTDFQGTEIAPTPAGAVPDLAAVLAAGNDAGGGGIMGAGSVVGPDGDGLIIHAGAAGTFALKDDSGSLGNVGQLWTAAGDGTQAFANPAPAAIVQAYVGRNTTAGSFTALTAGDIIAKKVSLPVDCLLTDIEAWCEGPAGDHVTSLEVALFADNAGAPGSLLSVGAELRGPDTALFLQPALGSVVARWFGYAIGRWCAAGDYWLGFRAPTGSTNPIRVAASAAGTDQTWTPSGDWWSDGGTLYPITSTTLNFAVRANTIR